MRAFMKIKIGALNYRVIRVKKINGNARGEIDFSTKTIRVLDGLDRDVETETLLHEVTHAISPNMGEQAVHTFSNRMFQMLQENTKLTKRLLKTPQK